MFKGCNHMPTIREVAKLAGVAPITVSRVVNRSGYVSQVTREKVEAAIQELGYVPNMLGPSLRFQQTMTLAAVITDIANPFWTTVTRGIEDVAQANGYSTILCNTDESEEKQEQYLQMLLRRRIDGILLVPACSTPEPVHLIQSQGIPVVILDRYLLDVDVDIVRADSETGALMLTEHLLCQGHKRIAMLSGPQTISTAVDRVKGYQRAVRARKLDPETAQIYWGNFTQESGYTMAKLALTELPGLTALVTANNFIALGALKALKEMGLSVPEDLALVTIDDLPPTFMINPLLTVVTQPAREMGQQAAQLLLDRVNETAGPDPQHIILPTKMVIRTSSEFKQKPQNLDPNT
jgi:LacI family transcriptional regulator